MFGFNKKKNTKDNNFTINELSKANNTLRQNLTNEIEARKFAEQNFEDAIASRIFDLEKLQEILGSNAQWKRKQLEATNYIGLALEHIKGKEN